MWWHVVGIMRRGAKNCFEEHQSNFRAMKFANVTSLAYKRITEGIIFTVDLAASSHFTCKQSTLMGESRSKSPIKNGSHALPHVADPSLSKMPCSRPLLFKEEETQHSVKRARRIAHRPVASQFAHKNWPVLQVKTTACRQSTVLYCHLMTQIHCLIWLLWLS